MIQRRLHSKAPLLLDVLGRICERLLITFSVDMLHTVYILGGAAPCSEGFLLILLQVPLIAWAAWQLQLGPTAWGTLTTHFTKPSEQVAAPLSI